MLERVQQRLDRDLTSHRTTTIKHRLPNSPEDLTALTLEAREFAGSTYCAQYGKVFDYDLKHALDLRITLVAKSGGEHMTIQTQLSFSTSDKTLAVAKDVFIFETKSTFARIVRDKSLFQSHARPAKKCTKHRIGMADLGKVSRGNRFLRTRR